MPDFRNLVENNKEYYEALWDYCTCIGTTPAEAHYPGMKCHVSRHTFNMLVYEIGRPSQIKRENDLAQAAAMSSITNSMR